MRGEIYKEEFREDGCVQKNPPEESEPSTAIKNKM
jgi:hypothetical protein